MKKILFIFTLITMLLLCSCKSNNQAQNNNFSSSGLKLPERPLPNESTNESINESTSSEHTNTSVDNIISNTTSDVVSDVVSDVASNVASDVASDSSSNNDEGNTSNDATSKPTDNSNNVSTNTSSNTSSRKPPVVSEMEHDDDAQLSDVTPGNELSIDIERPYYRNTVKIINFTLHRKNGVFGYFTDFFLEKYEDGKWAYYNTKNGKFEYKLNVAKSKSNVEFVSYDLTKLYDTPLPYGRYRIVQHTDYGTIESIPFEIIEDSYFDGDTTEQPIE